MNGHRFDGKGLVYSKSRPSYPESLLDYLREHNIISKESIVADIGSGTGIFSLQLQPYVKQVFAVEPNESMRENAENQFKNYSNLISVGASAENTTLQRHSVDCIAAAQAFHWFDKSAFARECRRILTPGGCIVLIWNVRNEASELIKKNDEINALFCLNYNGFSNGMNLKDEKEFNKLFRARYEKLQLENNVKYDLEAFIGRNLSSSFAPAEGEADYEPYIESLTDLFNEMSSDGIIEYPYTTCCYIGKL